MVLQLPIAPASPAVRCALNERRLVGTEAYDLSAFANARSRMDDVTLKTKEKTRE
jgi:hypothetical protein